MRKLPAILLFLSIAFSAIGQTEKITGNVSYRSSQHTYVRFRNTQGIEKGDTLFVQEGSALKPALVVQEISSSSCLCSPINGDEYPEGHIIIAKARTGQQKEKEVVKEIQPAQENSETINPATKPGRVQSINGSISAASYSQISGNGSGNQRFRYRLNANATNISGSKFSARSAVSYSHNTRRISEGEKFRNAGLKIYDLWVKYEIDSSSYLKAGRQINPRMSSTGPFDGITAEKSFRKFSAGITGGTAPGYENYGFDARLLQFGGYMGYDISGKSSSSSTSVAFVQQTFSGRTDRRYIYLQESAFIGRKLMLFGSAEADIYDPEGKSKTFTSGYFNLNWRATKRISLNGSYDARRNPIWHETYRFGIDSLIENELRQTLRVGTDIRIKGNMIAGIRSSLRLIPSDSRESMNLSGYFTWKSRGSAFSATISGNYLETSFIDGYSSTLNLRKNSGKLQAGAGYSYYSYIVGESTERTIRHSGRADITLQFTPKTSLMADYELAIEPQQISHFLYLQLLIRF